MRDGIHERIQAEVSYEDWERVFQAEEMLDAPLGWNDVKDLIMEDKEISAENMKPKKRRRDEVARGRRKWMKEDNIRAEKQEHSPSTSRREGNPEGFYSENWDDNLQEEDEWQVPEKFQRVSQMVFLNGVLSILCGQHQRGRCSRSPACT